MSEYLPTPIKSTKVKSWRTRPFKVHRLIQMMWKTGYKVEVIILGVNDTLKWILIIWLIYHYH